MSEVGTVAWETARAERAEKALHELTESISDAGHTTADGLRHEIEQLRTRAEAAEKERDELKARLFPKYTSCPHCGYRHPPDGVCV